MRREMEIALFASKGFEGFRIIMECSQPFAHYQKLSPTSFHLRSFSFSVHISPHTFRPFDYIRLTFIAIKEGEEKKSAKTFVPSPTNTHFSSGSRQKNLN
jgi:hypothetical protein